MKEMLLKSLVSLLKVKSIITLLTFAAFFYLSVSGRIDSDNFMLVVGMIATYFFNKDQIDKTKSNNSNQEPIYEVIEDE